MFKKKIEYFFTPQKNIDFQIIKNQQKIGLNLCSKLLERVD